MSTIAARRSAGTLPESNALIPPGTVFGAMSGVRRVGAKLDAAAFALRFDDAVEEVHAALDALKRACTQVRESTSLARCSPRRSRRGTRSTRDAEGRRGGVHARFAAQTRRRSIHHRRRRRGRRRRGRRRRRGQPAAGWRSAAGAASWAARDATKMTTSTHSPRRERSSISSSPSRTNDRTSRTTARILFGPSSPTSPTSSKVASLATELEACEAASRWTRAELARARARRTGRRTRRGGGGGGCRGRRTGFRDGGARRGFESESKFPPLDGGVGGSSVRVHVRRSRARAKGVCTRFARRRRTWMRNTARCAHTWVRVTVRSVDAAGRRRAGEGPRGNFRRALRVRAERRRREGTSRGGGDDSQGLEKTNGRGEETPSRQVLRRLGLNESRFEAAKQEGINTW